MGKRLSKIYTRTGDGGQTGLAGGARVDKDCPRIEVIGTVDELNSAIGLIRAQDTPEHIESRLAEIQHDLFDLGGELALPEHPAIGEQDITRLEDWLDELNTDLPALKEFILPAGGSATAQCHLARAICRRGERRMYSLSREEPINPAMLAYLNRLSDLLFVMARVLVRHERGEEVFWRRADPA